VPNAPKYQSSGTGTKKTLVTVDDVGRSRSSDGCNSGGLRQTNRKPQECGRIPPVRSTAASHSRCDSRVSFYALPSGALTFVNERTANYLGLLNDHPLRHGIDIAQRGIPIFTLCIPTSTRRHAKSGQRVLSTGRAGEFSFEFVMVKESIAGF